MQTHLSFHSKPAKKIQSRLIPKQVFAELPGSSSHDLEILELKLASGIRVQPVLFDRNTYQIEEPISFKNDVRQAFSLNFLL
jgi:hypothetical protein